MKADILYASILDVEPSLAVLDNLYTPLNTNVYWEYRTALVRITKLKDYFLTSLGAFQDMWLEISKTKKRYKKLG
jgi:hypothetical protein